MAASLSRPPGRPRPFPVPPAPLNLPAETYDFVVNVASEFTFMYPEEPSAIVAPDGSVSYARATP